MFLCYTGTMNGDLGWQERETQMMAGGKQGPRNVSCFEAHWQVHVLLFHFRHGKIR